MLNHKYKTSMCKYYEQNKVCPIGQAKCHFAHGAEDLRQNEDPLPVNAPIMPNKHNRYFQNNYHQYHQQQQFNPQMVNNFKTVKNVW